MKVDSALIEHVAKNARLQLSRTECEAFLPEFEEILDVYKKLNGIDVTGVEPALQPVDLAPNLREDKIKASFSQEKALANTKHKKDGYFKGPRTM
ncbi:Asp-tRNA(Asn)/Glu-tRNA(Gln) amidotransferase subunit GatC [Candidatus Woesearchaeota archaeon]|nr:Asp-tRNA(Asn)/Glu-tRNA(Gln) amidotransferase subunit GatC [Candidatus Woesearchaeota archaeon]